MNITESQSTRIPRTGGKPKAPHRFTRRAVTVAITLLGATGAVHAQQAEEVPSLGTIQVTGDWLGSGLESSVKDFAGGRTLVDGEDIQESGAANIGDVMRRIPGVQSTDNSGTAGSAISLNIGVRGLTGRYSPRSTVLLDGIPLAVAPYGQPQLSFAPVSLANIESIDVVRGGGAVRYGPQNVGGIINFTSRSIPDTPGLSGDVTVRQDSYSQASTTSTQYSAFVGSQLDNGLGLALLYSGMTGDSWRDDSNNDVNDLALKFRMNITPTSQIYGKVSSYDVKSRTPGGLTVAQYKADPFQNTRPTDYWEGERQGADLGYRNTISSTQEVEVRTYYNESSRASSLTNAARTQIAYQPRDYEVLGLEPRYTQRFALGPSTHDVTVGYRYLRERGNDRSYTKVLTTGVTTTTRFDNATDAQAVYIDNRIAYDNWRVTPGLRFEHIETERVNHASRDKFTQDNNKGLPSLNVAYLFSPKLTGFASYSTSFGAVQNIQLNSMTASNPLTPEIAKTFELGSRWQDKQLHAEITAFHMRFDNQILQVAGSSPAVFQNLGATEHQGIETALEYAFDGGALANLTLYATYTYTEAIQESGTTAGNDVPFYSRNTDTLGLRYAIARWTLNLSSTHQSKQYSDAANTVAESTSANTGVVPGFRVWNAQASWAVPGLTDGTQLTVGANNLADERYYTRNVDGNAGRMVGAPRTVYVQARVAF